MTTAVVDYGASNLLSVCNALKKIGEKHEVVSDPRDLSRFDRMILPGVGAAGRAMDRLSQSGFSRILPYVAIPFLGICLGMQLLTEYSQEDTTECLNIIPGRAKKFPTGLKVPQIGWNKVEILKSHPLFEGIPTGSYFYFVHSYYCANAERHTIAVAEYGVTFPCALARENFLGVQFHPEKSGELGLKLLRNFCARC